MNAKEIVRALRNCKAYKTKSDLQITMIRAADLIESLQAQLAERDKGCVFCNDERHSIREVFDEGTAKIIDAENHYALSVGTSRDAAIFNIFYCPMCGRRLEVEP